MRHPIKPIRRLICTHPHSARVGTLVTRAATRTSQARPALSSTKSVQGNRDPKMHQAKKGNQWHFGMKAHFGVCADSGPVHTVIGIGANIADVT